jgi:hypothetical protein
VHKMKLNKVPLSEQLVRSSPVCELCHLLLVTIQWVTILIRLHH